MATENITVRADKELKQHAATLFANLGLDMSSAINIFLRAAVKEGGIPFAVTTEPSANYKAHIRKTLIERMAEAGDQNAEWVQHSDVWSDLGL